MIEYGMPRMRQTTCGIFRCGATYDLPRVNTAVAGATDRDKFICCPRCGFSEADVDRAGTNSADGIREFYKREANTANYPQEEEKHGKAQDR